MNADAFFKTGTSLNHSTKNHPLLKKTSGSQASHRLGLGIMPSGLLNIKHSHPRLQSVSAFSPSWMLQFSLFGFPVTIHWMFWVITAMLFGGLEARSPEQFRLMIISMVAAFLSVLIHELGHAFLMRRYGAKASILLHSMGGLAFADRSFSRGKSIIVSLAGPLVEIIFGLIVWELLRRGIGGSVSVKFFLLQFAFISIYWGLMNLIPIYPLDGGHILVHVLGPRLIKVSIVISIVCAVAIGIYFFIAGNFFGGLVLGYIAFENVKRLRGQRPGSFMQP
ncbi:hypothetical protein BH11VER1_BH11VER1_34790 [soil metagenome]